MAKVTGVDAVIGRLYTKAGETAAGMERGLKRAALYLLGEAQDRVPVDTGNLKGSGDVRATGSGFQTVAEVVFTAEYALIVHEDLLAHHRSGQAKYLEEPARTLRPEMVAIIREDAKL